MDVARYLARIKFDGELRADLRTLKNLHRQHLLNIPFENLDVHYKRPFDLKPANVFRKVVNNGRGGFCYEVNSLFNDLLKTIGFKTRIISGKVITDAGKPGPEYDHMAIIVRLRQNYIADIGFGDLFIEPLKLTSGIQYDGRNYFKIEPSEESEFEIFMSSDGKHYARKYIFTLKETPISLFESACKEKQVSPDSHFVKNTICTRLTDTGRITVYNEKFTETIGDEKVQTIIHSDSDLRKILKTRFGIDIAGRR